MLIDQPVPLKNEIDIGRLLAYLQSSLGVQSDALEIKQFPGGHSNLTYLVTFGDRELVVKRAPPGPKAKSAHDMGREHVALSKLHGHYPYAPRAYGYCSDESVLGSAFCVMERLSGVIVRRDYGPEVRAEIVSAQFVGLLNALADLHSIDVAKAGIGDFGRPQGFTRRQVSGWIQRMETAKTDDVADFSEIVSWLSAHVPEQSGRASVIHNDFKLDNLVWDSNDLTRLIGVLDWEMSTVGDPLIDLACTLSFWVQPNDPPEFLSLRAMPTLRTGVLSRREAAVYYGKRTGLNMEAMDFYQCFGFFRRAAIEQQKYARFIRGATQDPRFANLNTTVLILRDMCESTINGRSG